MKTALILGYGYAGKFLEAHLRKRLSGIRIHKTQRSQNICFRLEERTTWKNLPEADLTFWTFPAEPENLVLEFLSNIGKKLGRLVVIGTTGSYLVRTNDVLVTESSPLDLLQPRVLGEEAIRKAGGTIVRASGIYGPGRNPLDWVMSKRVGASEKLVNFIQISDLAAVLVLLTYLGASAFRFLLFASLGMLLIIIRLYNPAPQKHLRFTWLGLTLLGAIALKVILGGYTGSAGFREIGTGVHPFVAPAQAAEILEKRTDESCRVFNEHGWGAYLSWRWKGNRQVFMHGFIDDRDFYVSEYIGALRSKEKREMLIEKFDLCAFLLERPPEIPGKISPLKADFDSDPRWTLAYLDEYSMLYIRNSKIKN